VKATREHGRRVAGRQFRGRRSPCSGPARPMAAVHGPKTFVLPDDVKKMAHAGPGPPAHPAAGKAACAGSRPRPLPQEILTETSVPHDARAPTRGVDYFFMKWFAGVILIPGAPRLVLEAGLLAYAMYVPARADGGEPFSWARAWIGKLSAPAGIPPPHGRDWRRGRRQFDRAQTTAGCRLALGRASEDLLPAVKGPARARPAPLCA